MSDVSKKLVDFLQNPLDSQEDFESSDTLIWIDWKECDENMLEYFNAKLLTEHQITITFAPTAKPRGVDIFLQKDTSKVAIPYHTDYTERDITIKALQQFIAEQYQIRWYMESLGGDTLGFVILPNEQWAQLEANYGVQKVRYNFNPVTAERHMFNMTMEEVRHLLKTRTQLSDG